MPIKNRKRINPTVERVSKTTKDDLGKRELATFGTNRPKTEGPRRIPPTISPTTRDWPTLRASQPPVRVVSMMTDIPIKTTVKDSHARRILKCNRLLNPNYSSKVCLPSEFLSVLAQILNHFFDLAGLATWYISAAIW